MSLNSSLALHEELQQQYQPKKILVNKGAKKRKRLFLSNLTWQHSSSRHCCGRGGGLKRRAGDCVFIEDICDLDVLHRRGVEVGLGIREATFTGLVWWTIIL